MKRLLPVALVAAFAACENVAPSVPIVSGPQRTRPGDTVEFRAISVDRDGDSVSYFFNWSGGPASGWTRWTVEGAELPVFVAFPDSGDFSLVVKARDAGRESEWSDTSLVGVWSYPPSVPRRPVGPETVVVYDTVTYSTSASHPLGRMVAVQFAWGESLGVWSGFEVPDAPVVVRHSFTAGGPVAVSCRAKDKSEYVSGWSEPETVFVVDSFGPVRRRSGGSVR
ncbi:hypothetical protein FJY71_08515 [candidate division WOR-3 bacterium]|nr:hypothetical protein [candidate division WOR-3 bacterium]